MNLQKIRYHKRAFLFIYCVCLLCLLFLLLRIDLFMELQDFHPIIVHIPIWLLVLYCLIEMLQTLPKPHYWDLFKTKVILLVCWTIWAQLWVLTGDAAAEKYWWDELVELHGTFWELSLQVFILISILYLLRTYKILKPESALSVSIEKYIEPLYRYRVMWLFALVGFALLSATGALWWALVHWPDPLAEFLIDLNIQ